MPLKGRRVGVYKQLFEDASPEVVSACRNAVDLLREHGCEASHSCHVKYYMFCHVLMPNIVLLNWDGMTCGPEICIYIHVATLMCTVPVTTVASIILQMLKRCTAGTGGAHLRA